jgi:hypothetical protein
MKCVRGAVRRTDHGPASGIRRLYEYIPAARTVGITSKETQVESSAYFSSTYFPPKTIGIVIDGWLLASTRRFARGHFQKDSRLRRSFQWHGLDLDNVLGDTGRRRRRLEYVLSSYCQSKLLRK